MVVMGLIIAKNVSKIDYVGVFLLFLDLLQSLKLYIFLSCRGVSKLWFGGSYVEIG